ncbi:MAG: hypothetical protein H6830_00120 [Planctomycetes bacterium]|nr:hypothetical protein [Planctomycetota bacterium]MCB9910739.1 hypothetical protein [Planctomycetota bacterium]MCB9912765.1 hypothetical protein [Planctomycetota bacterium]
MRMNEGVDTSEVSGEEGEAAERANGAGEALRQMIAEHASRLEGEAEQWRSAHKLLQRWSKPEALTDFVRLDRDLAQCQERFGVEGIDRLGLAKVVEALGRHLVDGKKRMRQELGRQLKDVCARAGLKLKVISREDPVELRIPPLAVRLDLDSGKAEILFAKQVLETCPASAEAILECHQATVRRLERNFDPATFFDQCWTAYKAGLAAAGSKRGDRLELVDFLGYLAMRMQGQAFFVEPVAGNYRGYSRGQFAFDVNRLRLARGLQRDGKRMNFGVATGTTATKKGRVIYMEDEFGQGEYKLNIYFTEGA